MKKEETNRNEHRSDEEISSATETRRLMSRGSYFSYAVSLVRSSSPYRIWQKFLTYFRRFRLLSVILTVSIRIVTIIETSALLIAVAAAAVILLPILLILGIITYVVALADGRRKIAELSETIKDRSIYVFIPTERPRENRVLSATMSELSGCDGNVVFCVLPPNIDPRTELFLTVRQSHSGTYFVKRNFFFRLRRLLKIHPHKVYYIY